MKNAQLFRLLSKNIKEETDHEKLLKLAKALELLIEVIYYAPALSDRRHKSAA